MKHNRESKVMAFVLSTVATALLIAGCNFERRAWDTAHAQDSIEAYETFLDRHPEGEHAQEARSQIETLSFDQAMVADDIPKYEAFLEIYPGGPFSDRARARIEELTPAVLVRTVDHERHGEGAWVMTVRDAAGQELASYEEKSSRTTQFHYADGGLSSAESETYVTLDDGTRVLTKRVTDFDASETPVSQTLLSPDGRILGRYTLSVEKSYRQTSWEPVLFYTELPFTRHRYDDPNLAEISSHPAGEMGDEVGEVDDINVIFSRDFSGIAGVLPRASLPEPVEMDERSFDEVGFTLVREAGADGRLPYLDTVVAREGEISRWTRLIYSKVPEDCLPIFRNYLAEDPVG